jgi:LysM repeat protein
MSRPKFSLMHIMLIVGLVAGLAIPLSATLAQGDPTTHTVQEGETLADIAALYNVTVNDLIAANEIEDPDMIFTGAELRIPAADDEEAVGLVAEDDEDEEEPAEPVVAQTTTGTTYVVQPRNTIDTIAQALNIDPTAIIAANFGPDDDPRTIFPGQVLVIPADAPPYTNRLPLVAPDSEPAATTIIGLQDGQGGGGIVSGDTHTVQPGEVLDSIAQFYNIAIESIVYANDLAFPYVIFPGQTLVIPGNAPVYGVVPPLPDETTGGTTGATITTTEVITSGTSGLLDGQGGGGIGGQTYIVKEGDSILSIVFAYDLDLVSFLRANAYLLNAVEIAPGTELVLP